jgi:hypothetical protein
VHPVLSDRFISLSHEMRICSLPPPLSLPCPIVDILWYASSPPRRSTSRSTSARDCMFCASCASLWSWTLLFNKTWNWRMRVRLDRELLDPNVPPSSTVTGTFLFRDLGINHVINGVLIDQCPVVTCRAFVMRELSFGQDCYCHDERHSLCHNLHTYMEINVKKSNLPRQRGRYTRNPKRFARPSAHSHLLVLSSSAPARQRR